MHRSTYTYLERTNQDFNQHPAVYQELENAMHEMAAAERLKLFSRTLTPSPAFPFQIERVLITYDWLSIHLPEEGALYKTLKIVGGFGCDLKIFNKEYNPSGVQITFSFQHEEFRSPDVLDFLFRHGTSEMKEKYRLLALFAEDFLVNDKSLDIPSFEVDINFIGKQVASELSEKMTLAISPFYQRMIARIEEAKRQIDANNQDNQLHSDTSHIKKGVSP